MGGNRPVEETLGVQVRDKTPRNGKHPTPLARMGQAGGSFADAVEEENEGPSPECLFWTKGEMEEGWDV